MKKTFALLLLLTVAACGGSDDSCGLLSAGSPPPASSIQNDPACSAAVLTCGGPCPQKGLSCTLIRTSSGCWYYEEYLCYANDSEEADGGASGAGQAGTLAWSCGLP